MLFLLTPEPKLPADPVPMPLAVKKHSSAGFANEPLQYLPLLPDFVVVGSDLVVALLIQLEVYPERPSQ